MTNTRKLAYIAILSAVSFLLLYFSFPLIPAADFLKVDFSILPVLIALVIFDFKSAIGVPRLIVHGRKLVDVKAHDIQLSDLFYRAHQLFKAYSARFGSARAGKFRGVYNVEV